MEYDGNTLTQQNGPRYFMLNKPQGYVCSTDDPDHPTILYFLDEPVARGCRTPPDGWISTPPGWC